MGDRIDGRGPLDLRPIRIQPGFLQQPLGSAFIEWGQTRIIVSVNVEDRVPVFLQGTGQGWLSADYTLLSRTGGGRVVGTGDRGSGRAVEIRRFIGRCLRAVVDRWALGERTLWVDCDVLEADGGTRVASVTAGFVALAIALDRLVRQGVLETWPITDMVAGVSLGLIRNEIYVDLNFFEDSQADVDANVVMTARGELVELQLTGEHGTLELIRLPKMLHLAQQALQQVLTVQYQSCVDYLRPDHRHRLDQWMHAGERRP